MRLLGMEHQRWRSDRVDRRQHHRGRLKVAPGDELTHVGQKLRTLQHCALHRRTIKLTCTACERERRFDAVALVDVRVQGLG
ncbi:hypothetical protein [Sphingomonas sp. GC_Shp_4]|uniref:hypothetical protein n=1 Tax=Sphingomonas sp. GC_Shp_4 TaxID=2937382 RepID=UPI00226B6AAF|nr:hypothetical protein [Sphingomonas sp. GC_Shp_4]